MAERAVQLLFRLARAVNGQTREDNDKLGHGSASDRYQTMTYGEIHEIIRDLKRKQDEK